MRPWRNLTITYGLVSVPVGLTPLMAEDKVSGNRICPTHQTKLKNVATCDECGPVDSPVTGYQLSDGSFKTDIDTKQFESERTKSIDLDNFVEVSDIDPVFFNKTYALFTTDAKDARGYSMLREAFIGLNIAAVGSVVLDKAEVPVVIRYSKAADALVLHTCHYSENIKSIDQEEVILSDKEQEMAKGLLSQAVGSWDLEQYSDTYTAKLKAAIAGEKVEPVEKKEEEAAIDLMAALEASVNAKK